ncbi:hypothetical protein KCTC52924_02692 [Arenibacter antarcticus]
MSLLVHYKISIVFKHGINSFFGTFIELVTTKSPFDHLSVKSRFRPPIYTLGRKAVSAGNVLSASDRIF